MTTEYVLADGMPAFGTDFQLSPWALRLEPVSGTVSIGPVMKEIDVPGGTIVDTESGLIYWGIPPMTAHDANTLLNRIGPLAGVIISQYSMNPFCNEENPVTSADIAMSLISQHIQDMV